MRANLLIRVAFVSAALAAVACAQATINIYLASVGTATEFAPPTINTVEAVVSERGGAGPLSALTYTLDGNTLKGSGAYTDPGGDVLDFSFVLNPASGVIKDDSLSIDGDWSYTGGTLGYANKVGGGTIALNFLTNGSPIAESGTLFSGQLAPEPAPFAAIGVGVIGLLARRRRKA